MALIDSRTKVVMLPGLDGTGLLFKPALDACPRELEPIVRALPATEVLDYQALAERLAGTLPAGEPFVLLGESFSGPLALELAARRPTGLLGVLLVATFVTSPTYRWIAALPWSLIFKIPPPSFLVRHFLVGRRSNEELRGIFQQIRQLVSPEVLASRVRLVAAVDAGDVLKSCQTPILYLQAINDRLVHDRSLTEILRIRPDVEQRRIEAPHLVFQTAPVEVWGHILSFVETLHGAIS